MSERLAKFMARSGVCSRRRAEEYIRQKRVTVNGEVVDSPAFNVEGTEKILFDGEKLPEIETTRLWLYYKPVGLLTTHRDDQNRPTVFDSLPPFMPRVVSVGRLDLNSEGLLLLTNNGELSRKLELPENGWSPPLQSQGSRLCRLEKTFGAGKGRGCRRRQLWAGQG